MTYYDNLFFGVLIFDFKRIANAINQNGIFENIYYYQRSASDKLDNRNLNLI